MRRATKSEAFVLNGRLQEWRTPIEMRIMLEMARQPFGYFVGSQTILQPWREAYRACQFAKEIGATRIRLGEDPPDAYFQINSAEIPVELTDVKTPSSTTTWEFNAFAKLASEGKSTPATEYDPSEDVYALPERLRRVIRRKVEKEYPPTFTLAVYAELFWFDSESQWLEREIAMAVSPAIDKFREVWALIGDRFFRFARTN